MLEGVGMKAILLVLKQQHLRILLSATHPNLVMILNNLNGNCQRYYLLTCKPCEEFWRDGVESRNVMNSEILIFQSLNTATTKLWKFFAIARDVTRLHAKKAIYGNTGNLTLQMHSIWWEITVAVLFTVVLCQALWSVSKWTVQIWNLHKNTYESLGRRLDSSREEFFISNKKAKITI